RAANAFVSRFRSAPPYPDDAHSGKKPPFWAGAHRSMILLFASAQNERAHRPGRVARGVERLRRNSRAGIVRCSIKEEAHHRLRCARATRIGVGAARVPTGPGMLSPID